MIFGPVKSDAVASNATFLRFCVAQVLIRGNEPRHSSHASAWEYNEDLILDVSVLGRFQDYMNAVLPDSNKRLKSRSRSMPPLPHCTTIDKNTLERARFEPNLIPKPPRSNSMRQPVDEPVGVTYSGSRRAGQRSFGL